MIDSWWGLSAWISAWTTIFSTFFYCKQNSWSLRCGAKIHSHHKMLLESTFYKMSPRKRWPVVKFFLFRITWYTYRRTTKALLEQRCCGWYPRTSTGFWEGFAGTNPNLAELLPLLGTNRQWESGAQWESEDWLPFFSFLLSHTSVSKWVSWHLFGQVVSPGRAVGTWI